jgi:uncharacterized membrane protein
LLSLKKPNAVPQKQIEELYSPYIIGRHRTVKQDAGFGVRQIVDVALKALSPGVNDTTTAVMCVDYLQAILLRLATRRIPSPFRMTDNTLRVIARGPSFETLLSEAFDQIRQSAKGNTAVFIRMLDALETLAGVTALPSRRRLLYQQAVLIRGLAETSVNQQYDCDQVQAGMSRFLKSYHNGKYPMKESEEV